MKVIDIYGWVKKEDERPIRLCRFVWDGGIVILESKRYGMRILSEPSYLDKKKMTRVKPSNTLKFFKSLPYCIWGSYSWATKIKHISRKTLNKNADFQRACYWQSNVRHLGEMRKKMSVTSKRGTRWRTDNQNLYNPIL